MVRGGRMMGWGPRGAVWVVEAVACREWGIEGCCIEDLVEAGKTSSSSSWFGRLCKVNLILLTLRLVVRIIPTGAKLLGRSRAQQCRTLVPCNPHLLNFFHIEQQPPDNNKSRAYEEREFLRLLSIRVEGFRIRLSLCKCSPQFQRFLSRIEVPCDRRGRKSDIVITFPRDNVRVANSSF